MCFGGDGGASGRAAAAQEQEQQRRDRINYGLNRVNSVFGQFDDPYYSKVSDTALAYYRPEVDRQYTEARKGLTFNLARSGNLASTAGAEQLRKLSEAKARTDVDIANRAQSHAADMRGQIETQRGNIINQLYATSDPGAAYSAAQATAQMGSAPPRYDAIGDLFSAFVGTAANAIAAERAGYRGAGTGLFSNRAGSSRVVS